VEKRRSMVSFNGRFLTEGSGMKRDFCRVSTVAIGCVYSGGDRWEKWPWRQRLAAAERSVLLVPK
jgi:hypothetical protein